MSSLFPIFLECKEWTLDPYWQDIFTACSIGKFPKGLKIDKNGSLYVSIGDKKQIVSLDNDPFDVFQTMTNIFRNDLGMKSDKDLKTQKEDIKELKKKIKETYSGTWKSIRPKKTKNILVLNYVLDCKEKYQMTDKEAKMLYSKINLAFIFKSINHSDVVYFNGKIHKIKKVRFDKNGKYHINIYNNSSDDKIEKTQTSDANKISQTMERYLKEFKNQLVKV